MKYIKRFLYKLIYAFYRLFPVDENMIVLESEGDFCDNSYALYEYMLKNGYLEKYHVYFLVAHPENFSEYKLKNTSFISKSYGLRHFEVFRALAQCKYCIYTHANPYTELNKRGGAQIVVYLTHGFGIKKGKGYVNEELDKSNIDLVCALSDISKKVLTDFAGCREQKAVITGFARNDFLFEDNFATKQIFNTKYGFDKYNKVILWMPTFRKSNNELISDDTTGNETGLPLFETSKSLEEFNTYLKNNNLLVVLKLHHLQAELDIFKTEFSNMLVLKDEMLQSENVQLYRFISICDVLITDYSSVANDWLLTDKAMIFTLDDYEEYRQTRGFVFDNVDEFFAGHNVKNISELENALTSIASGHDDYAEMRKNLRNKVHFYQDANSSKRILDTLGIKNN